MEKNRLFEQYVFFSLSLSLFSTLMFLFNACLRVVSDIYSLFTLLIRERMWQLQRESKIAQNEGISTRLRYILYFDVNLFNSNFDINMCVRKCITTINFIYISPSTLRRYLSNIHRFKRLFEILTLSAVKSNKRPVPQKRCSLSVSIKLGDFCQNYRLAWKM